MMSFEPGTVTLVGGGPGDPELITLGGIHALQAADVVCYDRLAPISLLADTCKRSAELIDVGKIPRGEFTPQDVINEMIVDHARRGKVVVRLKGGDSFVFGRGGEEWQACARAGIPIQVIPGVSSSIAAPEIAGVPVTHRALAQGFTVVSGHVPPGDERSRVNWEALAHTRTTLVILMGVKFLPQITETLLGAGMEPELPAAIVVSAGKPEQRVIRTDVAHVARASIDNNVTPPATTVIGVVADAGLLT